MANEWEASTVGDFCPFIYGKALPERSRMPGVFPVISSAGISGSHNEPLVTTGGIVIGRKGTVGSVTLSKSAFWPIDTAFYIADEPQRDLRFTYYLLKTLGLDRMNSDSAVPGLNRDNAHARTIFVPGLQEQRSIAHILGTLDDKIELNRKQNETLEAMARALFKAWFVDFEPVRAKMEGRWQRGQSLPGLPAHLYDLFPDHLVESELGEIPEGWKALPVYDLAKYVNGAAFKAFQPNDERCGLPIIKIAELKAGVTAQTKFSNVAMPEKYRIRTGDILFSWSGNPDTSIDTFIWAHDEAWLNQHIFRVDVLGQGERAFVIATLKYLRPVFAELARNKQTTGLGHVTVADMQRLLVVKPDENSLAAWDRVAAPIFDSVFSNEADSISVCRLRDTLLPKLISGELRVPDAERIVGAAV